MKPLEPVDKLAAAFALLPGVGKRSAQRMALRAARSPNKVAASLLEALSDVQQKIAVCSTCGHLTARDENPCSICTDPQRDPALLCVVEDPGDIFQIEEMGGYRGRYHALMGKLSPRRQQGLENPRIDSLVERVKKEGIREVILALNTDVESDATVQFLAERLAPLKVKVTRLAYGLPAGSGIAYADAATLSRALQGRQGIGL